MSCVPTLPIDTMFDRRANPSNWHHVWQACQPSQLTPCLTGVPTLPTDPMFDRRNNLPNWHHVWQVFHPSPFTAFTYVLPSRSRYFCNSASLPCSHAWSSRRDMAARGAPWRTAATHDGPDGWRGRVRPVGQAHDAQQTTNLLFFLFFLFLNLFLFESEL